MTRLASVDEIGPVRLRLARELVVAAHPGTASAPAGIAPEALPALRRRVEAAHANREALDALAPHLSPREVRGLVTGLEQWEGLRPSVAYLLRLRARRTLLGPLWRAWQRFPQVAPLRRILLVHGDQFGWEEAVGSAYAELARSWVAADEPGVGIQAWLDGLGKSHSDLPELTACPLAPDTPLAKLVRDAILTRGTSRQLKREGGPQLHAWSRELGPEDRVRFGRNYLVGISPDAWHRPIVDRIERSYGLPRRPRLPAFWRGIPEAVQLAFQRLFIRERLQQAFRDDTDRYGYWTRWADTFIDIQFDRAGSTDYAVLYFERFALIEFFQVGNAAYFYENDRLARLLRVPASDPSGRKEKYLPAFSTGDNRLIHNPPGGWYHRADQMVKEWLRFAR